MERPTDASRAQLRERAEAIWRAGLAAADPGQGVARALSARPSRCDTLIAVGKAAGAMAVAALGQTDPRTRIVVTTRGAPAEVPGARVFHSGHPVPDAEGLAAAEAVEAALRAARGEVLVLISGGGSALLPAPVAGVTLADKATVTRALLACGAEIGEVNLVRQHLSRLKGGGALRAAGGTPVRTLVLSDVVGDDLAAIASGPCRPPMGSPTEAAAALRAAHLWDRLPAACRAALDRADAPAVPDLPHLLIGSNRLSVEAMASA
ncbi:MAG: DUF4147 domain-containing protein, partial [Shimia sp.]